MAYKANVIHFILNTFTSYINCITVSALTIKSMVLMSYNKYSLKLRRIV